MRKPIGLLCMILLATGFVANPPLHYADSAAQQHNKKRLLHCTNAALAALKPIPELAYECKDDREVDLESPARYAALKAYLRELESSFTDPRWWATPVEDLNVCTIIHEARAMTSSEQSSYIFQINLYGDSSTRLLVVLDPCIFYSSNTRNGYILQRAGERVYATQVLDAYFTRMDAAADMTVAQFNDQRLVIVETHTSDGFMPPGLFTTLYAYTIDPRSHRAVPKKLFKEKGKLTNQFSYNNYLFEDEKMMKRWHAPEVIGSGRLASQFYVYTPIEHRMARNTYVWNGKYYAWNGKYFTYVK